LPVFFWLRWRLLRNQWRRAGALNAVLMTIVAFCVVSMALPLFIASFLIGLYATARAAPEHLMYAWDALVLAFLLFWSIGLVTELQRSEPLALSKFLHLPVSVNSAFLINYLSSLVRLSLVFFGPLMLGLALALIFARGVLLMFAPALLAAFLLMVTALTYQLQGWLASLMSNPRRRRTAIVTITVLFVLVFQLPNLINLYTCGGKKPFPNRGAALSKEVLELTSAAQAEKIEPAEFQRRHDEILKKHQLAWEKADRELGERVKHTARLVNLCLPIGWLPLGVMSAAEGVVVPPLLAFVAMSLIGTASLWRAYRTTVRQYQGQSTSSSARRTPALATAPAAPASVHAPGRKPRRLMLEARLPVLSEPVSAVALGGFSTILRAPEAKMILLTPLIMIPIFGSVVLQARHSVPVSLRPLLAIAALLIIQFGMMQMMVNQFGFDRDGFRVFVLSAARRRDILLGKNLALAPVAAALGLVLLPIVAWVYPMRLDHLLAMIPQSISMYLLLCILTNGLSIYAPYHLPPGTMKPSNLKASVVLMQLVMILVLFPLVQGLTLLPLGLEGLSQVMGWTQRAPVCLALTLAECALVILVYRVSLDWMGKLLQGREQRILESVTARGS
jgi:hypothetical protein